MQFSFAMPYSSCPPNPALLTQKAVMEISAEVEAAGFDAVAFTEHPAPSERWRQGGGHDALDPFVGLTFVAAATERLKLLTNVIVLPYRNPLLLAKSAATLDRLSGGRLILGLGAGYQEAEFAALGVPFDKRREIFDENLEVLKLAWAGQPIAYRGLDFDAQGVTCQPTPANASGPPIWLGGNSKLTLRRIARHGTGWMILPNTPEQAARTHSIVMNLETLDERLMMLRQMVAEAGRTDDIIVHFPLGSAREHLDIDSCVQTVGQMVDKGVHWTSWRPTAEDLPAMKAEIRRFGDKVISRYA